MTRRQNPIGARSKAELLEWLEDNDTSRNRIAVGDNWIFIGFEHTEAHAVRKAFNAKQPHFSSPSSPSEQNTEAQTFAPEDERSKPAEESASATASESPGLGFDEDIELSGTGDDIVALNVPGDEPAIATIRHDGGSNFQVTGYTSDGDRAGGLVNEIGPYEGVRPINWQEPVLQELDITADGTWHITIQPLSDAQLIEATGATEGSGDAVLLVVDENGSRVEASHQGESNFQVTAWGTRRSGMINEIGAYDGRVRMPTDAVILEVVADGSWSFKFD